MESDLSVSKPATLWQGIRDNGLTKSPSTAPVSWHQQWMNGTGSSAVKCAVLNCQAPAGLGAYVFLHETALAETHYIMSACVKHNAGSFSSGWHQLKSGSRLLRIPCECRHRKPAQI